MSHDAPPAAQGTWTGGPLARASLLLGSAGLLVALAADALAVAGRHLGVPFLGSIEMVQAAIVVAASSAMVGATLARTHAAVHILTTRLPSRGRRGMQVVADVSSAAFCAALAAGSIWIVADLWGAAEATEILGIPVKALRLFWCASAALMTGFFVLYACRRAGSGRP